LIFFVIIVVRFLARILMYFKYTPILTRRAPCDR